MNNARRNGNQIYKKIKFTYSVYGENGAYGGTATIKIHYGSSAIEPVITLESDYQTIEKAEDAIIKKAINWIDSH